MQQLTLSRAERVKSRKRIDLLFKEGRKIQAGSFGVSYLAGQAATPMHGKIQFGVGVGTRHFKKAVDRNRIKRLCRECWRTGNVQLKTSAHSNAIDLEVFLLFTGRELPAFELVKQQVDLVIARLLTVVEQQPVK